MASALAVGDIACIVYLGRCSVLIHPAPDALVLVRRALHLAQERAMLFEAMRCEANLGVVHLELGNWAAAEDHLATCLTVCPMSLDGTALSAVLNNLALVTAVADFGQAVRYLSSPLTTAGTDHGAAILSNLRVFRLGEKANEAPRFDQLAAWAAEECDAPLFDSVLFNQVRSLVDMGEPAEALALVESREVAAEERRDGALVAGRWARLQEEICERLGFAVPSSVHEAAEALQRSAAPQAWLYQLRWALCPIPLYDGAPWTED